MYITIKNTLVAGNADLSGGAPDCSAAAGLNAQGYNLIQDISGCIITGDATGHITGVDAGLGPLQDNGGSTPTHALLPGSPAFDAGNPANPGGGGNACAPVDQRGVPRPWNLACDIGAYEAMPSVQFVRRAYAVAESAGGATIAATLNTPTVLTANVTANYLTSEFTALAGSDYLTATGTLTFTPGVITTIVTVPVLDDSVVEATETFTLTLSAPNNARLGAPDSATITIIDDDGAHVFLPVINQ